MKDATIKNDEKAKLSRRNFLKTTTAGAVAGGIAAVSLLSKESRAQSLAWKQPGNNNKIIDQQKRGLSTVTKNAEVELEYYGHCAFKITSPRGVTLMVDPWRNDPSGAWGLWFPHDFPREVVDICLSTHAHFDHDAVDALDATMILDRMVGEYQFSDIKITGIADKHACVAPGWYKWTNVIKEFGANPCPPDNPGHMDMAMYVIETGGLRILMWGDNRHNPPESVVRQLGKIDVLTLPVDGSQHILSYEQGDALVKMLQPKVVIPTHYLCEGVSITLTTLEPADKWVQSQKSKQTLRSGRLRLHARELASMDKEFLYFKNNTAIG